MAHWCDNHPANKAYLEDMFGPLIKGHHGLFHLLQNIVETLKKDHRHHKLACKELSECITCPDPDDLEPVLNGLREGTVGRGKKTEEEI